MSTDLHGTLFHHQWPVLAPPVQSVSTTPTIKVCHAHSSTPPPNPSSPGNIGVLLTHQSLYVSGGLTTPPPPKKEHVFTPLCCHHPVFSFQSIGPHVSSHPLPSSHDPIMGGTVIYPSLHSHEVCVFMSSCGHCNNKKCVSNVCGHIQ